MRYYYLKKPEGTISAKRSASTAAKSTDQVVPASNYSQEQVVPPPPPEPQITLRELFDAIVGGVAEKANIRASMRKVAGDDDSRYEIGGGR